MADVRVGNAVHRKARGRDSLPKNRPHPHVVNSVICRLLVNTPPPYEDYEEDFRFRFDWVGFMNHASTLPLPQGLFASLSRLLLCQAAVAAWL